jgi:hypothetical protein
MKSLLFCIFIVFSAKSQQEIWLQPSRFFPIIEEPIDISIYEGLNFQGKISSFSTEKYQNFKHFGPSAKKISDDSGQIKVKFTEEGTHIIAIEATQNTKKYTNSEFQNYVNEQGNSTISVKNMPQNISEIRNEYGKMLVQVGLNSNENTRLRILLEIKRVFHSKFYSTKSRYLVYRSFILQKLVAKLPCQDYIQTKTVS